MYLSTVRKVALLDTHGLPWTMQGNLGSRFVEDFNYDSHGTANMTDDGAGLISQWKGKKTGLTLTAAGAFRPTWTAGRGVFFNAAHLMASVGVGALNVSSNSSSIHILCEQLALDGNPRNLISLGSSPQQRTLRTNAVSHRPGAITTAVVMEDGTSTKHFIGLSILQGKWANGKIFLYLNGEFLGWITAALTTGTTSLHFGASLAGTPDRFCIAYFRRVVFVNGNTSPDEDFRIAAEMVGNDAATVLVPTNIYWPRPPQPTYANTLAAINAAIAAAPADVADEQTDMSPGPTVVVTAGSPDAGTWPIGADVTNERPLLTINKGWTTPNSLYVSSSMGILGLLILEGTPTLFAQTTCFRVGAAITSQKVGVYGYGVYNVDPAFNVKMRLIVKEVGQPPRYVNRLGHDAGGVTGSNTYSFDFGSVARREVWCEVPGSNMFSGFYTETGGIVEPLTATATPRISWISDSFGSGTGSAQRFDSFNLFTGDRLNLLCGNFSGNVGGGWEVGSDETGIGVYNALQRIPDITDSDLTERLSLSITSLTNARGVIFCLGVNDANVTHTDLEWQAIILPILQFIRARMPWAPIICVGPWDRYFPSPVTSAWRAVDDGLQLAVAGVVHCEYLSMEGVFYEMVGGGNIHPTELGHQQLAQNLAPRIAATFAAM